MRAKIRNGCRRCQILDNGVMLNSLVSKIIIFNGSQRVLFVTSHSTNKCLKENIMMSFI